MIVGLNTNGMMNNKKLEQILSRDIKDIRISLDGPEEVNDRIRWLGNYKGALKTIERIAEYNTSASEPTKPTINVVLMKATLPYMEKMVRLAQGYGFKISFGLMRLSGRAKADEMLSPVEIVQATYTVQRMRKELDLPHGMIRVNFDIFSNNAQDGGKGDNLPGYAPQPFDNSRCPLGSSGLSLDAYGRIVPCGYLVNAVEMIGEDVRGKDLLDLWHNSPLLNMLRRITRNACTGCEYFKVKCNGGCPAMAYFRIGDINGRDPYCIKEIDVQRVIQDKMHTN